MLKELRKKSGEEQDEPIIDSVYDFIYHDGRRIASLLAQFDPSGHLTQLSQNTAARRGRDETSSIDAKAGIPGVAQVKNDNSETVSHARQDDVLRVYDPTWSNARSLLDVLDSKGLIKRDISKASLGQIVLTRGALSILDLGVVQKMWALSGIQDLIKAGIGIQPVAEVNRAARRRGEKPKAEPEGAGMVKILTDMMQFLPHGVQANLHGDERTWFTLNGSGMISDPSEMILKHGSDIPGDWFVLGILDAQPDVFSINSGELLPTGKMDDLVAGVAKSIAPMMRGFLGRPADAYGLTPLLVFRNVES